MKYLLISLLLISSTVFAKLDGEGLTVAVIDTGLRTTHIDFASRVVAVVNLSDDDSGDINNVTDYWGHGTLVTGIIAANGVSRGVAPNCNIVVIKIVNSGVIGGLTWDRMNEALIWVVDNHKEYNISVVNMSIISGGNFLAPAYDKPFRDTIRELRNLGIPVVVPSGNNYKSYETEGMCVPAIWNETISVGTIDSGGYLAAFSQRITDINNPYHTDCFAPGIKITSSGIGSDKDTATSNGTSLSCGFVSGTILLLQQRWLKRHKELPSVDIIEDSFLYKQKGEYPVLNIKKSLKYIRRISRLSRRIEVDSWK